MVHASPFEPHNEYIYPNSPSLSRLATIDADYVILGHTHYQMAERVGRTLVINPGSAGEPRDARNAFQLSYAVLDTATDEVLFDNFPDPTRAAVDPSIIPGGASPQRRPGNEPAPPNTAFWTPGSGPRVTPRAFSRRAEAPSPVPGAWLVKKPRFRFVIFHFFRRRRDLLDDGGGLGDRP